MKKLIFNLILLGIFAALSYIIKLDVSKALIYISAINLILFCWCVNTIYKSTTGKIKNDNIIRAMKKENKKMLIFSYLYFAYAQLPIYFYTRNMIPTIYINVSALILFINLYVTIYFLVNINAMKNNQNTINNL